MSGPPYPGMNASIAESRKFLLIGAASAVIAFEPVLALPVLIAILVWWTFLAPTRWLVVFFFLALLTPPLPFPVGDAGLNLAPFAAGLGVLVGAIRLREWSGTHSPIQPVLLLFIAILAVSSGIGALYSGLSAGAGSLARTLLFAVSGYVFVYALRGPSGSSKRILKFLFFAALAAAAFACIDYYFQFPAPAGFEAQFVWLDEGVFRRAQGLFYEASTLGNFCAFFLIMTLIALFRSDDERQFSKPLLIAGALVFTPALILSYSRASVLTVLIAGLAFMTMRKVRIGRVLAIGASGSVAAALLVRAFVPSFFASYWARLAGTVQNFSYAPNQMLSGRLANWQALGSFLVAHPWHALIGIGYKTLPYSDFAGSHIIADNTWLSLLVETGIIGLGCFVALNAAILRVSFRSARQGNFYGQWIFCFWTGEVIQMFSGDLITYWRVLPVYFWVLGTALRETV